MQIIDNGKYNTHNMYEFRHSNPKLKAYATVGVTNGGNHYMTFYESSGILSTTIYEFNGEIIREWSLIPVPKYAVPLIKAASKFIDSLYD